MDSKADIHVHTKYSDAPNDLFAGEAKGKVRIKEYTASPVI